MTEPRGILYGLPVRLLEDGGCEATNPVTGIILDLFVDVFGFNGAVLEYEPGGYWPTLWAWLTTDWSEEE